MPADVVSSCSTAQRPPSRRQPCGQSDNRIDDGHPIRAAEQRMRRIMVRDFGFQYGPVGYVRRVGDYEINLAVEFGEQPGAL